MLMGIEPSSSDEILFSVAGLVRSIVDALVMTSTLSVRPPILRVRFTVSVLPRPTSRLRSVLGAKPERSVFTSYVPT